MKVTVHLHMEFRYNALEGKRTWKPDVWPCRFDDTETQIYVGPREIEIDVPEDFDPTAKQVAALERQLAEAGAKFAAESAAIRDRISKLQALTYEVTA